VGHDWRMRFPAGPCCASPALVLAIAGSLVLLGAGPAMAHTSLTSTVPAAGATVADPVGRVSLVFSEPVSPRQAQVLVMARNGEDLARGPAQASDGVVTQPLGRSATAGSYLVSYRVLAQDGHPITGQVSFAVAAGAGSPVTGAGTTDRAPSPVSGSLQQAARTGDPGGAGGLVPVLAAGLTALGAALVVGAVRSGRRRHVGR